MRLFSEELSVGSYEILLTMPVTILDIVLGKFLASVVFVAAMLMPTVAYPITVSFLGQLDWGPVVGGYIGAVLLGGAFSAIGLFASSLTRNQIIAFIVGMAICFGLTLIDKVLFFLPQSLLGIFGYLGADFHFQNISKGIVDSRDILYFFSVCFVGLYGTHLAMQEKR
jgi:ABC-2 type transport system permease protein